MPDPAPDPDPCTATLAAFRRERARLRWIDRLASLIGYGFVLFVVVGMTILRNLDEFYVLPFCFGTFTNLSRLVLWKVRAIPKPVLELAAPDPARRAHARLVVEANRAELLGATDLPGLRQDEPELPTWPLDKIAERLAGRSDWRRIGRYWLALWLVAFVVVTVLVVLYVPEKQRL